MLSDKELITAVLGGETEKFCELAARYQQQVFHLAWSMLSNRADAEDAAQESLIRAYQKLSTYTDSGKFWGWLRRITVNMCLNKVRPMMCTSLEDLGDIPDSRGDIVYESAVNSIQSDSLHRTIRELAPAYRYVIVLRYLENMSYAEISEVLDESVSNIQVRLYRAKKMLREKMKVCVE